MDVADKNTMGCELQPYADLGQLYAGLILDWSPQSRCCLPMQSERVQNVKAYL